MIPTMLASMTPGMVATMILGAHHGAGTAVHASA